MSFTIKETLPNKSLLVFLFVKKEKELLRVRHNGNNYKSVLEFKNLDPHTVGYVYYSPSSLDDIKLINEFGIAVNVMNRVYGYLAFVSAIVLSFFAVDMFFPFLKFFIITKIFERLKFMNVNVGELLEAFLIEQQDFWYYSNSANSDSKNAKYFSKSRDKLDFYKVPLLSLMSLWDKYLMYGVVYTIRFGIRRVIRYTQSQDKVSPWDKVLTYISIKLIQISFLFTINDIVFFASRNILHQNVFNGEL
jgi:hypothetical protein